MNDLESAELARTNAHAFKEHCRKVKLKQQTELTRLNKVLSRSVYDYNVAIMSGDTSKMIVVTDKIIDVQDLIKKSNLMR